jgi:hypothetical protein
MEEAKPLISSSSEKLLRDLIELRKFGNELLQETSSVDSTEIEKKMVIKHYKNKNKL